jgi:hypothetical protein
VEGSSEGVLFQCCWCFDLYSAAERPNVLRVNDR